MLASTWIIWVPDLCPGFLCLPSRHPRAPAQFLLDLLLFGKGSYHPQKDYVGGSGSSLLGFYYPKKDYIGGSGYSLRGKPDLRQQKFASRWARRMYFFAIAVEIPARDTFLFLMADNNRILHYARVKALPEKSDKTTCSGT